MIKPDKSHNTGLRILEVLKILLEDNISKDEIIEKLKFNDDVENVYTHEAFLKYFNTLKLAGFDIQKDKLIYSLKNALFEIDLTAAEKKVLTKLIKSIGTEKENETEKLFFHTVSKLDKYVDLDINSILKEINKNSDIIQSQNIKNNIILTMKKFIYEGQKVNITYQRNKSTVETTAFELKETGEKDGKTYVLCYDKEIKRNKKIWIDSILSYEQISGLNSCTENNNSVVFEVYGRLATLYKLKQNETVIDFGSGYMSISNKDKDKNTLMLRLLKYGENCKIIKPKSFKDDFLNVTKNMIKNLEE